MNITRFSIILLTVLSGCGIFYHRQPKFTAYKYYSRFSHSDTNLIHMKQCYSFLHKDFENGTGKNRVYTVESVLYFLPNGKVSLYNSEYTPDWNYEGLRELSESTIYGMSDKGFYYSPDGKNLKIEVLQGFSTYGYHFSYYDCKIISKDSLWVKFEKDVVVQKHYGHKMEYGSIIGHGYKLFKYRPLK